MAAPIAFVILSPERGGVYESIIKPTFEGMGWTCWHVGEWSGPGNIVRQIVEGIARATLVVADLTALKPQVLYELGVAHTLGVPVVTLYEQSGDALPFELRAYRLVEYEDTMAGGRMLEQALKAVVAALPEWGANPSNPVQDFLPAERRSGSTIGTAPVPATPADTDSLRELGYKKELAAISSRRLHLLQVQQARQGASTHPSVLMEIEDLSEQLATLRGEIARLEQ